MADTAGIIRRIRNEIGDFESPFLDTFLGAEELASYDLSETGLNEVTAKISTVSPPATVDLIADSDYVLDPNEGRIILINPVYSPLHHGQTLIVRGTAGGLFSDADLETYVSDAMQQHAYGRSLTTRYRDAHGFIRYDHEPVTLDNLPAVEEPLVAYLAAIQCLWTLATDAATDIDISTAEGTFVPRTQRYRQLMQHIGDASSGLQGRYNQLAQQLNVGLGRIEMFTARRVSRTTNRLVPIFVEREYDDNSMPQRLLPPIDGEEYEDESGVPSPTYPGLWG
ncbi:hypothetical protein [Actinacidiphila sp. ITFR-21]|uniref:hypothetical protein n=1 Tax=Actinacidiphila sp. ITFR-21 TaxID=3075199 RepID=UPI0028893549|nr:hypothetical protein [Streptomyces sp. ITFR-21]WNI17628.1 hypothetical protein RLT57_20275 [Streptomyces sp. ITFR-21]WNI17768.1 hypothetical protein RLT57_20990 [Streptomyces sp. ITFR-21]